MRRQNPQPEEPRFGNELVCRQDSVEVEVDVPSDCFPQVAAQQRSVHVICIREHHAFAERIHVRNIGDPCQQPAWPHGEHTSALTHSPPSSDIHDEFGTVGQRDIDHLSHGVSPGEVPHERS